MRFEMKSFCLCILALLLFGRANGAEPRLLNGVIARVNDVIITLKDVQNRMAADLQFLERQYGAQPSVFEEKLSKLRADTVRDLVEEQLILNEFKTAGYKLPESFLEDRVNKDIERMFGDRVTLTKTLQAQGMTFETYRKRVHERTIIGMMERQNVPQDPVISPTKIETYFVQNRDKFKVGDQVKLRMIVVTNQPSGSFYSPEKLAAEIVSKLNEGASFAEMARIYSQGSQSSEGGDWGWLERSVLRADLAEKAFALKRGERTGVITAADGYYIMLAEDTRPAHVKLLSEVRDEIESTLKSEEKERLRKKWIERMKNKSFVSYF
jgi:peptidyl-prolyl cis-trans isomerase SurA